MSGVSPGALPREVLILQSGVTQERQQAPLSWSRLTNLICQRILRQTAERHLEVLMRNPEAEPLELFEKRFEIIFITMDAATNVFTGDSQQSM